jgi:hypothetical protein
MYTLLLTVCITFMGETSCQYFERENKFKTLEQCEFVSMIEKGQYKEKITTRSWAQYIWQCKERND